MSVLFFLLPLAAAFVLAGLWTFRWAAKDGQFDDLHTPPIRMLFDDPPSTTGKSGD